MNEFKPGLEGIVAVETEIAEPDREGGALRYRGVDIEDLVGHYPYENVWGLLVDDDLSSTMPAPEPHEPAALTGNAPADLQAEHRTPLRGVEAREAERDLGRAGARRSRAPLCSDDDDRRAIRPRRGRGDDGRVPEATVEQGKTAAEKFLLRWRGEADPKHVKAIDTYWICTAEHGLNASTFAARVTASTGADCGAALSSAVGALSGPLHGGAPAYVKPMLEEVAARATRAVGHRDARRAASGSWGSGTGSIAPRIRAPGS